MPFMVVVRQRTPFHELSARSGSLGTGGLWTKVCSDDTFAAKQAADCYGQAPWAWVLDVGEQISTTTDHDDDDDDDVMGTLL